MIKVTMVPQPSVQEVWPVVAPLIEKALKHGGYRFNLENIFADLIVSDQTLWIALEDGEIIGCWTVSITQYPEFKCLCYEYVAGRDVRKWLAKGHELCAQYARELGCTRAECQGRRGWDRLLGKLGYRQFAIRYECDL